jgi:hypothetical protein
VTSASAWKAAGLAVACRLQGIPVGHIDLSMREVWLPEIEQPPGTWGSVLATGWLAPLAGLGEWGGPPPPAPIPRPFWAEGSALLAAHLDQVSRLASFLDQVLVMTAEQVANYWSGELL